MSHLIEDHHYRRMALSGISRQSRGHGSLPRLHRSLEEHGIPFDPELVAPGNFYFETGAEAVKLFLDQRKVSFDAIVASNDAMAMGPGRN